MTEADLRAAVHDEPLSPRSPGYGSGTAPRVPPADPLDVLDVLDASSERRRREAALGRTTAGTKGDADLAGLGVAESAVVRRSESAERLLAIANEAVAQLGDGAASTHAMAWREAEAAHAALVAAGLSERLRKPDLSFREFLKESGDDLHEILEEED